MNCPPADRFTELACGAVNGDEAKELREHASTCLTCAARLKQTEPKRADAATGEAPTRTLGVDAEPVLGLINRQTRRPFVLVDDGPSLEQVRLLGPDGRTLTLHRELFDDDEVELPVSSLSEAQRAGWEIVCRELERAARASLRVLETGVTYTAARLTFYRDIIEPLRPEQSFTIECRDGTFTMTKRDFYDVFGNVAESHAYRDQGNYNYSKTPEKAFAFARP